MDERERFARRRRIFTARRAISRAAQSFEDGANAKITGRLELVGDAVVSPFTLTPCVFYQAFVRRLSAFVTSSGAQEAWKEDARARSTAPFVLVDQGGPDDDPIYVFPTHVTVLLDPVNVTGQSNVDARNAELVNVVSRSKEYLAGRDPMKDRSFWEVVIGFTDRISVYGRIDRVPVGQADYRTNATMKRAIVGSAHEPIILLGPAAIS